MKLFSGNKAVRSLTVTILGFAAIVALALCPVAQAQVPSGNLGGYDAYGNSYLAGINSQYMNVNAWAYPGCFAPNSVVTITIAAPAVISVPNTCIAGQEVQFNTTGALPTGLTAGTTYYIISAGLTGSAFEVSTAAGSTAVTTTGTQSGVQTASSNYANKTNAMTAAITMAPLPPNITVPGHCSLIWEVDNTSGTLELGLNVGNATSSAKVMSTMHYGAGGATLVDLYTLIPAGASYATPTAISGATTATAANTAYRADVDFIVSSGSTPSVVTLSGLSSSASYTVYLMPGSKCVWGN